MALFKINNTSVKKLSYKELDLEKRLQKLFEGNLNEILGITFLASEYSTSSGGRIDSLGIDMDGSPCIIEYKRNQNENVINQGLSYLKWLLDHKSDFQVLCKNKEIDTEIDWNSPRVICIAESYNKFDIDTVDILPIKIELLRYGLYEDDILYLEPESYQKIKISTTGIVQKVRNNLEDNAILQKTYSIDSHTSKGTENINNIFFELRDKIISLDNEVREEPKSKYIAYKLASNFVDVEIQRNSLVIYLNLKSGNLEDELRLARDLTKPTPVGHWGNGDYMIKLSNIDDLDNVFDLVKQSYLKNK